MVGEVLPPKTESKPQLPAAPEWATRMIDLRGMLRWDSSQTIAHVGIAGKLVAAVVDTGACCTIMDRAMATAIGLPVRLAQDGDCGKYSVPGTGAVNSYAGMVEGGITM